MINKITSSIDYLFVRKVWILLVCSNDSKFDISFQSVSANEGDNVFIKLQVPVCPLTSLIVFYDLKEAKILYDFIIK